MKSYSCCHCVSIFTVVVSVIVFFGSARAQHIDPPFRPDLVGRARDGMIEITIAGETQTSNITEATIVLRNDILDCDVSQMSCPVTIQLLDVQGGSFKFGDVEVQAMQIRNDEPIPSVGFFSIAPGTIFHVRVRFRAITDHFVFTTFDSQSGATFGRTPPQLRSVLGDGLLLSVPMEGTVDGREVTANVQVFFRLVNEPPVARATSEALIVLGGPECAAPVVLDARQTGDPDGNLASLRWFDENGTFVGEGSIVEVSVRRTGEFRFLLVAEDNLGAASTAETTVNIPVLFGRCVITLPIYIEPGGLPIIHISHDPNRIEVTTVAIPTTSTFDAATIDAATVRFGKTGTEAVPVKVRLADVDGDGNPDVIFEFRTQDTGLQCGDHFASLAGRTKNGQVFQGSDSIVTVRGQSICA